MTPEYRFLPSGIGPLVRLRGISVASEQFEEFTSAARAGSRDVDNRMNLMA